MGQGKEFMAHGSMSCVWARGPRSICGRNGQNLYVQIRDKFFTEVCNELQQFPSWRVKGGEENSELESGDEKL